MERRADRLDLLTKSLVGLLLPALLALPVTAFAARYDVIQTKPFGLLYMGGRVNIGYNFDERDNDSASVSSKDSESLWQEEFLLRTKSFVYHPGFLNIELNGGPVFVQQQFDGGSENGSRSETLFNIQSRLNFLEIKNYPVSVYYTRSHPSIARGSATRFIVPSERLGVTGSIHGLFANSTRLRFDAYDHTAKGSSEGYVVDDEIEQAVFSISTSYRQRDRLRFKFDRRHVNSASGSPGRPINRSDEKYRTAELLSQNYFGEDRKVSINQSFLKFSRDTPNAQASSLDDYRYRGNMKWRHGERTNSSMQLRYVDSQRSIASSKSRGASYSISRDIGYGLSAGGGVNYTSNSNVGFDRRQTGLNGNLNYRYETVLGPLSLSAAMRSVRVDQEAAVNDIEVFDEAVTLADTAPTNLASEFVVAGSVSVRNVTSTQNYIEGIDYRVLVVGSVTSLQRLIGGDIADGETVLVDYRYATSGTAKFDTTDLRASGVMALGRYFNVYTSYFTSNTDVLSGELTNRINDGDRFEAGVNARNRPIGGWLVTGDYRYTNQQDNIAPFTRNEANVSLERNLWGRLYFSVSAGFVQADYETSDEDENQRAYGLGIGGNPFRGASVQYNLSYLEDVGGSLNRETTRHRLSFQWGFRQVQVRMTATYSDEELGTSASTVDRVSLQISRFF